ncbi:hypothetical protein PHYBLDRAFT_67357 [Phycomyces blakesleeanus NRRL 1555(-)]|uniref:Tc1-like transposase DDE domain-containing protein n=1 Tax=Phycomyces blakesleeanus (strain ATCC 8743b / DSM 1359 / FGSC 10004 / NBRC 33097 / NRRL 1555) TaxID=763407 RepID=A0A162THM3_PHYB8|nr:hypothetical protein PHYBLDRAFT_67357 [Phycomyces blakesleeanus NRRL 1555(-)]OAD67223.1 hypothetical protein PHYBLDRAFT_67357 [Phycomyces blakesleeanus NRRL 1555(-)]|eukprot:XP_018285263.1 hypothetical protein PHYBLDRAFT_67357 [Phycomyces blakesleeanus NRRL 1555(-)]
MGFPRTTINTAIKRCEKKRKTSTAKPKTRPGRPKKLSVTYVASLCLSVRRNLFESYAYHQRNLAAAGVIIYRYTVIRHLKTESFLFLLFLHPCFEAKLNPRTEEEPAAEVWKRSKDGVGFFWAGGLGPLSFLEGFIDQDAYVNCLSKDFNSWYKKSDGEQKIMFIFQEDGASCHTGSYTTWWKNRWEIKRFDYWPSQSPGLNPIEHVWHALKANPKACILQEWERFDPGLLRTLVASMPDRIRAVIEASGNHITY